MQDEELSVCGKAVQQRKHLYHRPLSNFLVFFLDRSSKFLAKTPVKEMIKRPEMRRDGTSFVPRVRGSSESISRAGGAAGINQERPKTMKEN
jgi:hypothetical protein